MRRAAQTTETVALHHELILLPKLTATRIPGGSAENGSPRNVNSPLTLRGTPVKLLGFSYFRIGYNEGRVLILTNIGQG